MASSWCPYNYETVSPFSVMNKYNPPATTNGSGYNAPPPSRPGFEGSGPASTPGGGGGASLSQRGVFPINSLSPYQNKWTIRARVSSKPSIRRWSNSRGEGQVFNVELVDESVSSLKFHQKSSQFLTYVCRVRSGPVLSTKLLNR